MQRVESVFMAPGFSVKDVLRVRNCDSHHLLIAHKNFLMSAMGLVGWTNQSPWTNLKRKVATNSCRGNCSDWKQVAHWLDGWTRVGWMPDARSSCFGQKIDPTRCFLSCRKIQRCSAWTLSSCPMRAKW